MRKCGHPELNGDSRGVCLRRSVDCDVQGGVVSGPIAGERNTGWP